MHKSHRSTDNDNEIMAHLEPITVPEIARLR